MARSVVRALAVAPLALLCACGGGAEQSLKDAASIGAGAQLAAQLRLRRAVTGTYTADLAESLGAELRTAQSSVPAGSARDALQLQGELASMERAARSGADGALRTASDESGRLAKRLSAAADSISREGAR